MQNLNIRTFHEEEFPKPDYKAHETNTQNLSGQPTEDTKYFPFDSQNCTLKFGSWSFSADEQLLLPTKDNETLR